MYSYKDIKIYRHTDIQTYRHTDIQTQTYRHTDIQTYRHTAIQTGPGVLQAPLLHPAAPVVGVPVGPTKI